MRFKIFIILLLYSMVSEGRDVIVAVIDTGIDLKSLDQNQLWVNSGEIGLDQNGQDKSKNQIDDDRNGFIDDVNGYNFSGRNNILRDSHGHGTHIATTILKHNARAKIMALKYYDPTNPQANIENTAKAFLYAAQMGAHIINYSGGGRSPDLAEYLALKKVAANNILVIAASGNNGLSNDQNGFYPASYPFDNIISVGSSNSSGEILNTSNFGIESVDILAIGEKVKSLALNGQMVEMTGTSQAAAQVTGLASQLYSQWADLSSLEIKKQILATGEFHSSLKNKVNTSKVTSFARALSLRDRSFDAFDREHDESYNIYENEFVYKN